MGTKNQTTTATQAPPAWVNSAYQNLFSSAANTAQTPYTPYTGGFTADQQGAFQNIRDMSGAATPSFSAANDAFGRAMTPTYQNYQNYMNPYVQQVVDATRANMQENNGRQQQTVLGNAVSRGAIGGNRVGVAQAELARQQKLADDQTISGIYRDAFQNSMNMAGQQQQADLAGGQALAGLGQAQMSTGLSQAAAQLGAGTQQQQFDYQQYLNQMGFPYQQQSWLANIYGLGPNAGGTTTQQTPQGNIFSQLLGAGLGAASLFANGGVVRAASGGVMPFANDNGDWAATQFYLSPYASNDNAPFPSYVPNGTGSSPSASGAFPSIQEFEQDDPLSGHGGVLKKGANNVKTWVAGFGQPMDLGLASGGRVGLKWQGRAKSNNIEDRRGKRRVRVGGDIDDYDPFYPYADDGAKHTGTFKKKRADGGVVRGYADGGVLGGSNPMDWDAYYAGMGTVGVDDGRYLPGGMAFPGDPIPDNIGALTSRNVTTFKVDSNGNPVISDKTRLPDTYLVDQRPKQGIASTPSLRAIESAAPIDGKPNGARLLPNAFADVYGGGAVPLTTEDTASASVVPLPRRRPMPTVDDFAVAQRAGQRGTPAQRLFGSGGVFNLNAPAIGGGGGAAIAAPQPAARQFTSNDLHPTVSSIFSDNAVMPRAMSATPEMERRWFGDGYAEGGVVRGYAPGGFVPYSQGDQFVTDPTPGYSMSIPDAFTSLREGRGLNLSPDMRQALLSAGAGMMASRSPFALQGIGEGALKGVESWNQRQELERENAKARAGIGQTGEQIALQAAQTAANIGLVGAQTGATQYTFTSTPAGVRITDALNPLNVQFVPWGGILPDGTIASPGAGGGGAPAPAGVFNTQPNTRFDPRLMAPETTDQAINEATLGITDARGRHQVANTTQQQLQEMKHNLATLPQEGWLTPGNDFTNRLYLARGVNTALNMMGLEPVFDEKQVAAGEDLNKLTTRLGFELSNNVGSSAASIVTDAVAAVPGGANSQEGAERIIAGLEAMNRRQIDYYTFLQGWAAQNNGSILGADEWFNSVNPPELYALTAYVPEQAILFLRENPEKAADFNAKYGNGKDVAKFVLSAGG